jgi:hypothetical protein
VAFEVVERAADGGGVVEALGSSTLRWMIEW